MAILQISTDQKSIKLLDKIILELSEDLIYDKNVIQVKTDLHGVNELANISCNDITAKNGYSLNELGDELRGVRYDFISLEDRMAVAFETQLCNLKEELYVHFYNEIRSSILCNLKSEFSKELRKELRKEIVLEVKDELHKKYNNLDMEVESELQETKNQIKLALKEDLVKAQTDMKNLIKDQHENFQKNLRIEVCDMYNVFDESIVDLKEEIKQEIQRDRYSRLLSELKQLFKKDTLKYKFAMVLYELKDKFKQNKVQQKLNLIEQEISTLKNVTDKMVLFVD